MYLCVYAVSSSQGPVFNDPSLIAWNANKTYLRNLEVDPPPTRRMLRGCRTTGCHSCRRHGLGRGRVGIGALVPPPASQRGRGGRGCNSGREGLGCGSGEASSLRCGLRCGDVLVDSKCRRFADVRALLSRRHRFDDHRTAGAIRCVSSVCPPHRTRMPSRRQGRDG